MSINIFSENVSSFDNEIRYTTKVQNDIEYVNTTGDTLTGDLNLNENKIILKDSKAEIQHARGDDFDGTVFRNSHKFAYTDFQNNILFSATTNIFENNKRIVNFGNPVTSKDAATKEYVDSKQVTVRKFFQFIYFFTSLSFFKSKLKLEFKCSITRFSFSFSMTLYCSVKYNHLIKFWISQPIIGFIEFDFIITFVFSLYIN